MKRTHYVRFILFVAGIFLINACQEEEPEQPHGVKINFQAITGLKSTADSIMLEEAFIGVGEIDLMREGEADSAIIEKIVYNGPYVVDLLMGRVSPAIRWIFAEPGQYRKINVATYNSLPGGNSIFLKGTWLPADGGEAIPFELLASGNYAFGIVNPGGITIRQGEDVDLLVVFNLSDLFSGMDLNELEKNEHGVVVISEADNISNFAPVMNSFEAFSRFGINNGLPLFENDDQNFQDEVPGEDENPGEEDKEDSGQDGEDDNSGGGSSDEDDDNSDNDPDDGSDDEPDDDASGDGSGNSDNNDEGTNDEDEDEGSDDNDGNDDSGSDNDDGQDSGSGNGDDGDDDNTSDDDDSDDGSDEEQDDDEEDDDDSDDDDDGDDDDSDDDDNGDDDDDDDDEKDDDKGGKGNNSDKGKGNDKGNGGNGKGNK